jgi:hypothetical protein
MLQPRQNCQVRKVSYQIFVKAQIFLLHRMVERMSMVVMSQRLRFYSADSIGTEVQISEICQMADAFDIFYQVLADFLNVQLDLGVVR